MKLKAGGEPEVDTPDEVKIKRAIKFLKTMDPVRALAAQHGH